MGRRAAGARRVPSSANTLQVGDMKKRIIILGTNHCVQASDYSGTTYSKNLLSSLLRKHQSQVLFEEWQVPEFVQTIGKGLAVEYGLPWENLGTPDEPEFATDEVLCNSEVPVAVRAYGPIQNQINRERFMLDKIVRLMINHNDGFFICGLSHIHSMAEKLITVGFDVEGYQWQQPVPAEFVRFLP
jgi:hypothetical protein